jgi:hypothetical protein
MIIHGFAISAFGHCAEKSEHESAKLVRSAVGYLTSLLEGHGNSFHAKIPLKRVGYIDLRWTSEHLSAGIGTFYVEADLLSTNIMVSGINPAADQKVLETGQSALRKVCETAGERVADDLLRIQERPAVATIRWSTRDRKAMDLVADMEICLAAAFLEQAFKSGEMTL